MEQASKHGEQNPANEYVIQALSPSTQDN